MGFSKDCREFLTLIFQKLIEQYYLSRLLQCQCLPFCCFYILHNFYFPLCNYIHIFGTIKLNLSSKPCIFSNIVLSSVSLARVMFCFYFFSSCTSNSKLRHLACHVSFFVCISRNFYSTFFKHHVIDPIYSLCLTNVVVNVFSWRTVAFFISSNTQMNVPSIIAKFYYRAFRVSFASFSSSWVFSNFCWVSWNFLSNCLWANIIPTLFFSRSYLWASNSRGSIWCLARSHSYSIMLYKCSNSKESCWILFP